MFTLQIEPRVVLSWDTFRRERPGYAIALDGFVSGPSLYDPSGPWVNLNHHEGVGRLATRATCEQALMSLQMGLLEPFMVGDQPRGTLYVNDVDQDVCLSVWLFQHHLQLGSREWERVHRLVSLEGILDTTAGAYPFPLDSADLREIAWVFKPYSDLFRSRYRPQLDSRAMAAVIEAVGNHISGYVRGHAQLIALDLRYDRLGGGSSWALVREHGLQSRTAMRAHGIRAFVSVRTRASSATPRWDYTLARMSPYVRFPVVDLYEVLNEAEHIGPEESDRWSGSDTIGGSPRHRGSGLSPEDITQVIENYLVKMGLAPGQPADATISQEGVVTGALRD